MFHSSAKHPSIKYPSTWLNVPSISSMHREKIGIVTHISGQICLNLPREGPATAHVSQVQFVGKSYPRQIEGIARLLTQNINIHAFKASSLTQMIPHLGSTRLSWLSQYIKKLGHPSNSHDKPHVHICSIAKHINITDIFFLFL